MNQDCRIIKAGEEDLKEILDLQYLAYQSEAALFGNKDIPPLKETLEEVIDEYNKGIVLKMISDDRIIGSVRAFEKDGTAYIGKLMVHPDHRRKGYGKRLLLEIEKYFPDKRYELFTSTRSKDNIRLYESAGYKAFGRRAVDDELIFVYMEKQMRNPWEDISLSDYENHMSLDSVMQLQTMNSIMKEQFDAYGVDTAMILGIACGNGLEHVSREKYRKVYGVDINCEYLKAVSERYAYLSDILECLQADIINDYDKLPHAELVIANLFVEYVGYKAFQMAVMQARPLYISCVIQINTDEAKWVSDSPFLHAFDRLDEIHCQMEENALTEAMSGIGYRNILKVSYPLPNGKALVRLDYSKLTVRRIEEDDAKDVSDLIRKTISISNKKDYPGELMEQLIETETPEHVLQIASWTHFYVVLEGSDIIGCGAIGPYWGKEDESSLFTIFVDPGHQGKGVGRKIMETLENDEFFLRAKRIEIPASITGVPFYLKMGYHFKDGISEPDEEHLIRMEKNR